MEKKFSVKQKQLRKLKHSLKLSRGKYFGIYSNFLNSLDLPRRNIEQKHFCNIGLGNMEIVGALKYTSNNKAPLGDK